MSIVLRPEVFAPSETPIHLTRTLRSFCAGSLDAIAECGRALDFIGKARQADALHDQQLVLASRVAAVGAQEADVHGCGCASRFDRVGRLVANAQAADAREDSFIDRAFAFVERGMAFMRNVAGTADRLAVEKTK